MRQVSSAYREAIQLHRSSGIRNSMYAKITFGVVDQYALNDATFSFSTGVFYSSTDDVVSGENTVSESYATWEQDFWALDGTQRFPPNSYPIKTGYTTQAISDQNGFFDDPPYIDIHFSYPHSMVGLTLQFDTVKGICPEEFTIITYENGAEKDTYYITGNTDVVYQGELGIENADRILIQFTKTRPFNRVRVASLLFGIAYSFGSNDLIDVTHTRTISPISLELPSESLTFTLFNENGKYSIDSKLNVIKFLQKEQFATLQYGYDVDGNGAIEWLEGYKYWLDSWATEGIHATFTCKDIFYQLSNTKYYKGVVPTSARSGQELATDVLEDAGLAESWIVDPSLGAFMSLLPLPVVSHSENLQMIANMGRCSLEQTSSGGVRFRFKEQVDMSEMTAKPSDAVQTVYSFYRDGSERSGGIFDPTDVPEYATWEQDFFALDGSMAFLPESNAYNNSGYVSDVFPDPDGEYQDTPSLQLNFGKNISFGSLEIDIGKSERIDQLRIRAVRNTSPTGETSIQQVFDEYTTGENREGTIVLNLNFDRIYSLYIYCLSNHKNQRARIKRIRVNYPMDFEILSDDIIGNPIGELLPRCSEVTSNTIQVKLDTSEQIEPMQTVSVPPNTRTEIQHQGAYHQCRFEVDNPQAIIEEETHYAFVSFIKISGVSENTEVKLYANTYSQETIVPYVIRLNSLGEPIVVDNPIASNYLDQGNAQLEWMGDYLSKRFQYTVETLGYPEIDPGDLILYDGREAFVIEANIRFSQGAMRETLVLRGEEKLSAL